MEHADIRHVAVIGTGTIGASWTAFFMSRGLSVAASDPAPQAEATLRRFVAASWPALVRLGAPQPLPDKVPEDRLSFHAEPEAALAGVDFDAIAGGGCGGCRASLDRRGGGGARSPAARHSVQRWKFCSKLLRPSYRPYKLEPWLHIDPRFCVLPPIEGTVQPSS